uniref:Type II secretion system protein n=1 Tax=Pseudomonas fluorescens (strain SBW25) TaxID=216595 RepID=A0A0G4E466_PSEFS|nr:hypothetical protein PQBR57_0082 [Pseudomonas fluorescens SBW25]
MFEMMVVLLIIGVLTVFLMPSIWQPIRDAKIKGGVAQAKEIVSACDQLRVTPISSLRDASNQKVTPTYGPLYASWTDATVLSNKLSSGNSLPTENPFGRPYYFKMTERTCSVAVELDELIDGWEGYDLETAGTRTRIVISKPARSMTGPAWVQHQKRLLTGETIR